MNRVEVCFIFAFATSTFLCSGCKFFITITGFVHKHRISLLLIFSLTVFPFVSGFTAGAGGQRARLVSVPESQCSRMAFPGQVHAHAAAPWQPASAEGNKKKRKRNWTFAPALLPSFDLAAWIYYQLAGEDFFFYWFDPCRVAIYQELQEQVAKQRRLLQSVANVGEELLSQQTTPNGDRYSSNRFSISWIGSVHNSPLWKRLPLHPAVRCPSQGGCCWTTSPCLLWISWDSAGRTSTRIRTRSWSCHSTRWSTNSWAQ